MYDPGPSDEELFALGLLREDVADTSTLEVWPENWIPYKVFSEVSTQWRVGPGGRVGLDYLAVNWLMNLTKIKQKKRFEILKAIQVMEYSALKIMSKR